MVVASGVKLSIILSTLLSTFATGGSPDLCDDVFLDAAGDPITDLVGQTLSRFCKWTGPDVPAWDANVCCTFADDAAPVPGPTRAAAARLARPGGTASTGHSAPMAA
jgi:hypothetical protein